MSSDTVLRKVRLELSSRFKRTDLGKDSQAIVIDFQDGMYPVDVVPAAFYGMLTVGLTKHPVYQIPDGDGGWILTSPSAHNRYISRADLQSGGKLKNVARLVKYWRWCRTPEVPLTSFHVEMVLASHSICVGAKSYAACLRDLFATLASRDVRALQDPLGISGYIRAANTQAKLEQVKAAIDHSAYHSDRAVGAESLGNTSEAVRQWDIVFNGLFPKS